MSVNLNVIFADIEKRRFQYGSDLSIYTEKIVDGESLYYGGLTIKLDTALTSQMILLTEKE